MENVEHKMLTSHYTTLCGKDKVKDKVNSVNEINLALHLAVLNEGHGLSISAICKSVEIQNMLDQLNEIDSTRLYGKHRQ